MTIKEEIHETGYAKDFLGNEYSQQMGAMLLPIAVLVAASVPANAQNLAGADCPSQ